MTQRILIALSLLVMAISIGGYVWQSNKVTTSAERTVAEQAQVPAAQSAPESLPRIAQIDRQPAEQVTPTLIPTAQSPASLIPIQDSGSPPLQRALEVPAGSALQPSQDGLLRYRAILSFVNDIKVVAQTDGIILDILVDEGSLVAKDSPVIQIDNRLAMAEKEVAVQELESARLKAEDDSQIKFSEAS